MSVLIHAPYPTIETVSVLPNPQFSDSEALADEVEIKRAMNGKVRTYVKTKNGRRKLIWEFQLARPKTLELYQIFKSYFSMKFLVEDHHSRRWVGNFVNNPFEFASNNRAGPDIGTVKGERYTIRLEFEGVEQ
ncbi:MAG: hypothetical protein KDA84_24295 [Planctomycetaceae bacterium]|nr:hypothetical protein [Planctomycetaceae bacterium]